MRKKAIFVFYLVIGLALTCYPAVFAESDEVGNNRDFHYTCFVKKELTEEAAQINEFLAKYFETFENHDLKALKELYSDEYRSGDGFTRKNLLDMMKESWDMSPDLTYSGEIQDIRFDDNFATVEICEDLTGTTKEKSDITDDIGLIESSSRTVLYLRKFGKGWKIVSDKILYEESSIRYGEAKDIDVHINAPEQVFPDDNYTVMLRTEIPEDMFAVASIISEPLKYPRDKAEEIFRQIPMDIKFLERVVQANNESLNELAIASVSYCSVKKDAFKKPEISISGTAILIKRVNVVNILTSEK